METSFSNITELFDNRSWLRALDYSTARHYHIGTSLEHIYTISYPILTVPH